MIFSFDAELHLVHYKSSYSNIGAAVAANMSDSLAVVGILIKDQYLKMFESLDSLY